MFPVPWQAVLNLQLQREQLVFERKLRFPGVACGLKEVGFLRYCFMGRSMSNWGTHYLVDLGSLLSGSLSDISNLKYEQKFKFQRYYFSTCKAFYYFTTILPCSAATYLLFFCFCLHVKFPISTSGWDIRLRYGTLSSSLWICKCDITRRCHLLYYFSD